MGQRRPLSSRPTFSQISLSEPARELRKKGELRIPGLFIDRVKLSDTPKNQAGRLRRRVRFTSWRELLAPIPIAAFLRDWLAQCRSHSIDPDQPAFDVDAKLLLPAQEQPDIARHSVGKIEYPGAEPETIRPQIPLPPQINLRRLAV